MKFYLRYWMAILYGIILSLIFVSGNFCFDSCGYLILIPIMYSPIFMLISFFILYCIRNEKKKILISGLILIIVLSQIFTSFGFHPYTNTAQGDFGTGSYANNVGTACDGFYINYQINDVNFNVKTDCYMIRQVCKEECRIEYPNGEKTTYCTSKCENIKI